MKPRVDPANRSGKSATAVGESERASFGNRSNTPPKIIEQMANEVSAGMPTSQGSQYFGIRSLPIMSHG